MASIVTLSPAARARCWPFAVFMVWLALRGSLPEGPGLDTRWIYGLSVLMVGSMLVRRWREYGELARQTWLTAREALEAVVVGLLVFVAWIHLDAPWMTLADPTASFLPIDLDGRLIWPLVILRWIGAALVVPLMEELFWRSFLMRWVEHPQFERVDPQRVGLKAIVVTTFIFMLAHTLWLAAVVAGLAYAVMYRRTGKLWSAVIAHAVTNGALGLWVVQTRQWQFW